MAKRLMRHPKGDFATDVGARLRAARVRMSFTQKEIGKELGLSEHEIAHYERGRRIPPLPTFAYLCERYQVSPSDILGVDFPPSGKSAHERLKEETNARLDLVET